MGTSGSLLKKLGGRGADGSGLMGWIERRIGLTSSGVVLVILAIIGYIAARIIGARAMFMLVYCAVGVFIVAIVLGRKKLAIEADRSDLPARVREGQAVEVQLVMTGRRRVSTVVMEEQLHAQLGTSVRVPIASLPPGQAVQHTYTFLPRLRGIYHVGPLIAIHSDPFGLTRRRQLVLPPAEIIVHPNTEQVEDRVIARAWEDPPKRPPNSKPWPTGFEFYGMRDYSPGDDPRRIVWKAVARKLSGDPRLDNRPGIYLVREAEQGITDQVAIIIDTDEEWHSPGEPSDTFEAAIRAAASLGAQHLKDGFAVTMYTNSGRVAKDLRQRRNIIPMLDIMARTNREKTQLTRTLDLLVSEARKDTHHILITPFISAKSASRLAQLLSKAASFVIVHLAWEDSEPDSLQRATALGCNIVQLPPRAPLSGVFRSEVGAGLRRH